MYLYNLMCKYQWVFWLSVVGLMFVGCLTKATYREHNVHGEIVTYEQTRGVHRSPRYICNEHNVLYEQGTHSRTPVLKALPAGEVMYVQCIHIE